MTASDRVMEWLALAPADAEESFDAWPADARSVACVAVSAFDVTRRGLGFGYVRQFARLAALTYLAPAPVRIELALTGSAPGSTRAALERLLQFAPTAGPSRFDRIWALSADRGLVESVAAFARRRDWTTLRVGTPAAQGWRTPSASPWERSPPRAPDAGEESTPPHPTDSTPIDTRGRAVWARTQPLDVLPGEDLVALAARIDSVPDFRGAAAAACPSLVTQVGLTTTSTRGVARLAGLPSAGPRAAGDVHHGDGLELRRGPLQPQYEEVERAGPSAGHGFVTLRTGPERATLVTELPWATLLDVRSRLTPQIRVLAGWHRVDDDDILSAMPESGASGPSCRVLLNARGDDLRAEIVAGLGRGPAAWWIEAWRKLGSKQLEGWAARIPRRVESSACPARLTAAGDYFPSHLVLRTPSAPGALVQILHDIAPGNIGAGRGGGLPVAVFASRGPLPRGKMACVPIQCATFAQGVRPGNGACSRHEWELLQRLPLLVPLVSEAPGAGVQLGDDTHV